VGFGTTARVAPGKNLPDSGVTSEPVGYYATPAQLGGSGGIGGTPRPVTCYQEAHSPRECSRLTLSAAGLYASCEELTRPFEPARALAAETLTLERTLSDLVNYDYGLSPAEIALMWQTAPPRLACPFHRLHQYWNAIPSAEEAAPNVDVLPQ
jgi:hypothetical protein